MSLSLFQRPVCLLQRMVCRSPEKALFFSTRVKSEETAVARIRPVFSNPQHIIRRQKENAFFIADSGNNRVVYMSNEGNVNGVVGFGSPGLKDGSFETSEFLSPYRLAYSERSGLLYALDNVSLRKISFESKEVETISLFGNENQHARDLKIENGEIKLITESGSTSIESALDDDALEIGQNRADNAIGVEKAFYFLENAQLAYTSLTNLGWPTTGVCSETDYFNQFRYEKKGHGFVIDGPVLHLRLGRSVISVDYQTPKGYQLLEKVALWEVGCQGSCVYYTAHANYFDQENTTEEEMFMADFEESTEYRYNVKLPPSREDGFPIHVPIDGTRGTGEILVDLCVFLKKDGSNIPHQDFIHLRIPARFSPRGKEYSDISITETS